MQSRHSPAPRLIPCTGIASIAIFLRNRRERLPTPFGTDTVEKPACNSSIAAARTWGETGFFANVVQAAGHGHMPCNHMLNANGAQPSAMRAGRTRHSSRKSRSCLAAPRTAARACKLWRTRRPSFRSGLKPPANSVAPSRSRKADFCLPRDAPHKPDRLGLNRPVSGIVFCPERHQIARRDR